MPAKSETEEIKSNDKRVYQKKSYNPNRTILDSFKEWIINNKKLSIIGAALLGTLIIAYFIIATYLTGINSFVSKYEKVTESNDADAFIKLVNIPDNAKGNKENFERLIENSIYELSGKIIDSAKKLDEQDYITSSELYLDGIHIADIKKSKFFFLFTKYKVSIIVSQLAITSEQENLEVDIDDEIYNVNGTQNLGNFIPGIYEYTANSSEVDKTLKGIIRHPFNSGEPYEISYETFNLTAYSSVENAEIYFNDEPQGILIPSIGAEFKNLIEDESVRVTARFESDGKTYVSDQSFKLQRESSMDFTFEDYEKQLELQVKRDEQDIKTDDLKKDEVIEFFNDFIASYEIALSNADFDYVELYFEAGTTNSEDYNEFVTEHQTWGEYYYTFNSNEVESIKQINDTTFELISREKFDFERPVDGKYIYDRIKKYTIVYEEDFGEYAIRNIKVLKTDKEKI